MKPEVKKPNNAAGYLALILCLLVPFSLAFGIAIGKRISLKIASSCPDQIVAPGCISKSQLKTAMEVDRHIVRSIVARKVWHDAAGACTRATKKNVVVEIFDIPGQHGHQIWGHFELVGLDAVEKED